MTNKVTKYGLMTIAAVLLVAMAFAGAASADSIYEIDSADDFYQFVADVNASTVADTTYSAQLTDDITLDNKTVFNPAVKTNVILDLNGHVITSRYTNSSSFLLKDNTVLDIYDNASSRVEHVYTSVTVTDAKNPTGLSTRGGSIIGGGFVWQPGISTIDYQSAGNPMSYGDVRGWDNRAPAGKCFQVNASCTIKIHDGTLANFIGTNGGSIAIIKGGECFIDGGLITDCGATNQGGGICAWGNATIYGGEISDCYSNLGGGVYIGADNFTMSGGAISGCTAGSSTVYGHGGGVYASGMFDMSGGTIANCYSFMQSGGIEVNGGTTTISGTALIENCSTYYCGGGITCISKGTLYVKGGTFRNNFAGEDGGAIDVANYKCWVSGGIFENNTAQYGGGAINVGYSVPYFIITGGIFRDNHDSTGSNAVATSKRVNSDVSFNYPNLIIGGDVTLEDDQSFRLIDLPSGTGSFKIGTPTTIDGTTFTNEKFTGSFKNFVIDNENLDGRTLFEIKVASPGQDATDVLGRLGLKDTDKWTLTADDNSDPKKITIKLNKPVVSSASVLFNSSDNNATAYVNITLTDDNDAATAVVEFWNGGSVVNRSNVINDVAKGSTVGGFVVKGLDDNTEYSVKANLTMTGSAQYFVYDLGTFNCSDPKITTHPQSAVYKLGEAATALEVGTEAVGATYQWENSTDGKTYTAMTGETYDNITPSTDAIGTVYYRVNVTAADKSVYSLAAAVEVYDTYSITYNNPQSGSSGNPTTYSSNETITLNDPVMPYYVGDWVDRISGNMVSVIYKGTTGDLILDAQYTAREYYIMYIDGGTTTNPASYNILSGTIYLTDATKDGYKFIGWYDNAAFTGDKVTSISSVAPEDITLYARWVQLVTKTVDSEGNATFTGDERIATARISGTQTLLSEVSGLTPGKTITFVKDIPGVSASDLPAKSGYYTNLYSAFEINYDDTLSGEAQVTLKVTLANGDSADSLRALHQSSSGWEDLEDVSKTQSGNEVTIVGNVSSFSPFAVVSYSAQPQQYTPSSSKQTGSTVILQEGQTAPTAYATAAPTVAPTVKPTEKPATPTVIATEKPTTQATQQSPAPFVGLLAGLGAAAVLLRLRK